MEIVNVGKEKIYLNKSKYFGWRVVYPIKEEGVINWKHLLAGRSWSNLIIIGIYILLAIGAIIEYTQAVELANECLKYDLLLK